MDVIPVLDVRHGVVVRAVAGDRANYRPIHSPLFEGCTPHAAAAGFMALRRFPVIYLADLDGIEGRGADFELARQLLTALPGVGLWVDNGSIDLVSVDRLLSHRRVIAVLGTEYASVDEFVQLSNRFGDRVILSLDFKGEAYLGPSRLLQEERLWPAQVVVMTLAHVGRARGPDLERISEIARRARPGTRVYAAGGVRDRADLMALKRAGVAGALVSSALHAKTVTADDLDEVTGRIW